MIFKYKVQIDTIIYQNYFTIKIKNIVKGGLSDFFKYTEKA